VRPIPAIYGIVPLLSRLRLPALALAFAALFACGSSGPPGTTTSGSGGATTTGGSGGSGGSLPPPKPLSVLNWNVHQFFDSIPTGASGELVLSATDYKKKREAVGAVLASLDADVVALAEVETKPILDDLNGNELQNRYVSVNLVEGNDPRGIDVAVMSKIQPDKVVSHKDDLFTHPQTHAPYRYARDCLEVHITHNGRRMAFLAVHFKAKAPPDDPDKRYAEAFHTREIADKLLAEDPARVVIVLGDFNDVPGSAPVGAIAGAGETAFVDAATFAPEPRYSFNFNGTLELIDHQFMSPLGAKLLDDSSVVLKHGAGIDDGSKYASDHAPLFAVYDVQ
jgi:endonuclease/exonuclease/phosphatase family metal-dependent hydrolase